MACAPIIGNLSTDIRERTAEKYWGKEYSASSGFISSLTNIALYSACGACTGVTNGGWIGAGYGVLEMIGRVSKSRITEGGAPKDYFPASLVGKVVSIPIEIGIGVYDGIKSRGENSMNNGQYEMGVETPTKQDGGKN